MNYGAPATLDKFYPAHLRRYRLKRENEKAGQGSPEDGHDYPKYLTHR